MGTVVLPHTLTAGAVENIAHVQANLEALRDEINGLLDAANIEDGTLTKDELVSALATVLGVSSTATVRRGKSIIATEESVTSTSYATLTTPDQVSSVVLPTDGLIVVAYQALWKSSVADIGKAAIFLDAEQLKIAGTTVPIVQEVTTSGTGYNALSTEPRGLASNGAGTSHVTTGQVVASGATTGGACLIFAAADTYDVAIKFKSASGSVTAKERKLWTYTIGF